MKTIRAFIYLIVFVVGLTGLLWLGYGLINTQLDQRTADTNDGTQLADQTASTSDNTSEGTPLPPSLPDATGTTDTSDTTDGFAATSSASDVTVKSLAELKNSYFPAIGTVTSAESITLYPITSGSVKNVNFREGDYVKTGDIVVELTGANLSEHASETQLKVAETTLSNARIALTNLEKTSAESLKTAGLQLQSAKNQTAALAYDLAVITQNQAGLADSLNIMRDSWDTTQLKNLRDEQKGMRDIDDLIFTLNAAQDDRARTRRQINDLNNQLDALPPTPPSPPDTANATTNNTANQPATLQTQLAKLQTALDAQDAGIEALYVAIDKAKYGLNTAQDGATLGENQVRGQLAQSESQAQVLDLTLQSTKTKLGYTGDSSDALKLAEQAYNYTKIQLETALDATRNGVKLAELNVEQARSQASGLQIKAPFEGIITALDLYPGQTVSPQASIIEILNSKTFELEVGVDVDTADRISTTAPALLELGGRQIELPIKSVGLKVDDKTKLVKVTLQLPNIFFKLNQNLKVLLPLTTTGLYLPLDAVIIGTEDQFVYLNNNGEAKKVNVKLGEVAGDQVEILSGLPADAEVIVSGAKNLTDGQTLTVVDK